MTNTLQTVCPWLQDVAGSEYRSARDISSLNDPPAFVYHLPLYAVNTQPLSTFIQLNPDRRAVERIFAVPVGFFWETVETGDECFLDAVSSDDGGGVDDSFQTATSLISSGLFRDGRAMLEVLGHTLQAGLSIAGVRLVYPASEQLRTFPLKCPARSEATPAGDASSVIGPVLTIALRGFVARTVWMDMVGPSDPVLARRIHPNSLCALYGGDSRDSCLLYSPQNPYQMTAEVVRWFGGRVPESRVITIGDSPSRPRASGKSRKSRPSSEENQSAVEPQGSQAALLCAATYSDIFLAVSPLISSRCLALVLCVCQQRGYKVCGIRRMHLTAKRASQLGG